MDEDLHVEDKQVEETDQQSTPPEDVELKNYLGIHGDVTGKDRTALEAITQWLDSQTAQDTTSGRLWALKQLENRLASPKLGQSRLDLLSKYIRIQNQVRQAEQERDLLLK